MARKARKNAVRDIVKNLLDSEIPEIQDVAKELAERIKKLEEHSWKLQHYAIEIDNLSEEEAELAPEISLGELIKDLEKTLDELRQKPAGGGRKAKVKAVLEEEIEEEPEEEIKEVERVEEPEQITGDEAPRSVTDIETYTTPEGFVVRKLRR